jgi:negative regulator of flagellin synthesis FlgM
MRITGTPGLPATTTTTDVAETAAAKSDAAASASPAAAELQSAVLQPALAKGELPFNASKLAGLIERFHGGRS